VETFGSRDGALGKGSEVVALVTSSELETPQSVDVERLNGQPRPWLEDGGGGVVLVAEARSALDIADP
jgi:hypothetical protein